MNKIMKFYDNTIEDGKDVILCPYCDYSCTHHGDVQVFSRDREDSKTGQAVAIKGSTVTVNKDMEDNPSSRRDGIRIHMVCEADDSHVFTICIEQHKGETFIYHELPDSEEEG